MLKSDLVVLQLFVVIASVLMLHFLVNTYDRVKEEKEEGGGGRERKLRGKIFYKIQIC